MLLEQQNKKALIVTEYMTQGRHIQGIGWGIHNENMSYDVVSLARYDSLENYQEMGVLDKSEKIFSQTSYSIDQLGIYATLFSGLSSKKEGRSLYSILFQNAAVKYK